MPYDLEGEYMFNNQAKIFHLSHKLRFCQRTSLAAGLTLVAGDLQTLTSVFAISRKTRETGEF